VLPSELSHLVRSSIDSTPDKALPRLRSCSKFKLSKVYDVLSYLASGMTYEEILEDFPYLTQEDILACLSYAADREHQILMVQA
jgi:Protein of unknown function (DUF433)